MRKAPLSEAEIRRLLNGRPARSIYSARARRNKELGIDPAQRSDDELIALMAREPTLIRRPLLQVGQNGEVIPGPDRQQLRELIESLPKGKRPE